MNSIVYLLTKALLSGAVVVAASELAKRNNTAASIIHSLPLVSLMTFLWLYHEKKNAALIGQHAWGTFWFVLPTLPMFVLMPWFVKKFGGFWPAIGTGVLLTICLYFLTMRLLKVAGITL
ncbi:MAG TPA: DUF3147 family protein [Verrucomicrobiales bacterium]|nr:DUF3147 family protein [Verrucomicrobiales bacterium]